MATSGTYTFTQNRDAIIARAARLIGAIASGETPDSNTTQDFSDALNAMAKHWQADGINIWTTGEAILFQQLGQVRYVLGSGSTDNATDSFVSTTLTADVALGAGSVTVGSITGISSADYLGIQIDDGTMQWTTVNGAPSGSTIIPAAILTDSASAGNLVVTYTTKIVRPLKIISSRRFNFASGIDTPMMEFDRLEYAKQPNKTVTGSINAHYYDRRGGANTTGYIYLWPSPAVVDEAVKFTYCRPIQDMSAAGNDFDFPTEWFQALAYNLAVVMMPEYDLPETKMARIEKMAGQYLAQATWWERELTDISFVPAKS